MEITLVADAEGLSPYVLSVWVALQEKGLAFEIQDISLAQGEQHGAAVAPGLTSRVPMLRHDRFWLSESLAIVEYLEDAFPGTVPMLPRGLQERARARQIMNFIRSDVLPLRMERPTSSFLAGTPVTPLTLQGRAAADKVLSIAQRLLEQAVSPQHLFSTYSVADADLAVLLMRLVGTGEPVPEQVRKYVECQWQRPSVQSYLKRLTKD